MTPSEWTILVCEGVGDVRQSRCHEKLRCSEAPFCNEPGHYCECEFFPVVPASSVRALRERAGRLADGLRERGILPGCNPDGENDDVGKALLVIDGLRSVIDGLRERAEDADALIERHDEALALLREARDGLTMPPEFVGADLYSRIDALLLKEEDRAD